MRDYTRLRDSVEMPDDVFSASTRKTRGGESAPLSKAHISRKSGKEYRRANVTWFEGGSLLKVCRGHLPKPGVGGVRKAIRGFSNASRRRLLYLIARIKRSAALPLFVTLTYPYTFPDVKKSKKHFKAFCARLKYVCPGVGLIWKLEPQDRGAPHYHLLVWGGDLLTMRMFVPQAWYEIAGGGDYKHFLWHSGCLGHGNKECVQQVRSWKGVWNYAAKYLGKTFEVVGWEYVGRYWGVVNKGSVPFGEEQVIEVDMRKAQSIQRYQRRFAFHHKKLMFRNNPTVTIFCDADQWVSRLVHGGSAAP